MYTLFKLRWQCFAAIFAAVATQATIAEDDDLVGAPEWKITQPLVVLPADSRVYAKEKSDTVLSVRQISFLRSVKLDEPLVLRAGDVEYRLDANKDLQGAVIQGSWNKDEVIPKDLSLAVGPGLLKLMGGNAKNLSEEEQAAIIEQENKRLALMREYIKSMHFETYTVGGAEQRWVYCGMGDQKPNEGRLQSVTICLRNNGPEAVFDQAYIATSMTPDRLRNDHIIEIEGIDFAASFSEIERTATGLSIIASVQQDLKDKKKYLLRFGLTDKPVTKSAYRQTRFLQYHDELVSDEGLDVDFLGDSYEIVRSSKKNRFDGSLKAGNAPVVVTIPYGKASVEK